MLDTLVDDRNIAILLNCNTHLTHIATPEHNYDSYKYLSLYLSVDGRS